MEDGDDLLAGDDVDGRVVLGISSLLLSDSGQQGHGDVGVHGLCLGGVRRWRRGVEHLLGVTRHHVGRWHHVRRHVLRHVRRHVWRHVRAHVRRHVRHRHGDQMHRLLGVWQRHYDGLADAVVHWHVSTTLGVGKSHANITGEHKEEYSIYRSITYLEGQVMTLHSSLTLNPPSLIGRSRRLG